MNFENIKLRLQQFNPIFLPGSNGGLRVLEKTARSVFDIEPDTKSTEEEIIAEACSILEEAARMEYQPPIRLSINVPFEAIKLEDICPALVVLIGLLGTAARTIIYVHVDQPLVDWSLIRSFARSLRESLSQPSAVEIILIAPFGEFNEAEMSQLLELGIRVKFAAGWTTSCAPGSHVSVDKDVLRSFSEFGFRTSIEWYVHEQNMQAFEEEIPDLLIANCYSGFSLPLISQNPYYRFDANFPALPNSVQYCQLLVRNYRKYPYYDDVFLPLATLVPLISEGGWHSQLNIPATLNLLVDEKGNVNVFRQIPARALSWKTLSEVIATPVDALKDSFLSIVGVSSQDRWVPYCRECNWRYTCGGLDEPAALSLLNKDMDPICAHRKVFLEHFAKLRVPNWVF